MYTVSFAVESRMLSDYLRYIFPPQTPDGPCAVSTCRPTGALLAALAEPSLLPPPECGRYIVQLDLPWARNVTSGLAGHWVALSKSATARCNMALRAEFELEFAGYYRRGEQLGLRKMDIIDAFILSRGLAAESYDALHKRIYRNQQRTQEQLRRKLVRKAYYINESIDYTGLYK